MSDSAILITGATGFVGAYTARLLLARGYTRLHAIRRADSKMDLLGAAAQHIHWHEADLLDYFSLEDAFAGIDTVIHSAALVSFLPRDRDRLMAINRGGTRHVIDAALHQGVRRVIHVSSVAALGRHLDGQPITEASKWEDGPLISHYSRSKFLAELELWRGQAEGLAVAAVYPSIILGAGRWQEGTAKLFAYAHGQPTFYPTGATGFVDVRDVAEALVRLIERDVDGDRFLLNAENRTYQQLLTDMTHALGLPAPTRALPYIAARALAWIDALRATFTGSPPLLTRETVLATYQNHHYDNQHSQNVLGLPYRSLTQTIQQTASAFTAAQGKTPSVLTWD